MLNVRVAVIFTRTTPVLNVRVAVLKVRKVVISTNTNTCVKCQSSCDLCKDEHMC